MSKKNLLIKRIQEFFQNRQEIILVYLFGSVLNEVNCRDIDIGVVIDTNNLKGEFQKLEYELAIARELESFLGPPYSEIDLKILNSSPLYFQYEVIKSGEIIFCKNEKERVTYEAQLQIEYLDLIPLLAVHEKTLRKEIKEW